MRKRNLQIRRKIGKKDTKEIEKKKIKSAELEMNKSKPVSPDPPLPSHYNNAVLTVDPRSAPPCRCRQDRASLQP
jgi:hypothetical protein